MTAAEFYRDVYKKTCHSFTDYMEFTEAYAKSSSLQTLKEAMPELIEKAWREEERCASGARRFSRTDYACGNLGRLVLELSEGVK